MGGSIRSRVQYRKQVKDEGRTSESARRIDHLISLGCHPKRNPVKIGPFEGSVPVVQPDTDCPFGKTKGVCL